MHPVIAMLGGIALLIMMMGGARGSSAPVRQLPPPEPPKLPPGPDASPAVLEDAAKRARDQGRDDDADKLEQDADIKRELDASASVLPTSFKSPIKGVSDAAWTKYVKLQKQGKLNTTTKSNHLGLFFMGYRVLQDLGYVQNAHKVDIGGRQVWDGDFIPPLTKERFLSDAMLQYEAFARMTAAHAQVIASKYKDILKGSDISMSGLLGVSKFAGLGGLNSWLTDQAKRKPETTNEFKRVNGLF